jgi:hypothetical protein
MERTLRIRYPGAFYHVMSRGDRREAILGEAAQEAVEVQVERLVAEGLRRMGWSEETLKVRRKGHPQKVGWRGNCARAPRCPGRG